MIKACNIKRGDVVDIGGMPHVVESLSVQSPSARGGATLYKVRFRNVQTKQKVDQSLRGDDGFQEADFDTVEAQYLYKNGDQYTFMDMTDYTQYDLPESEVEEAIPFLVDDMEGITLQMSDGRVLGIQMPSVVELQIVECDPSMRGASATSRTKPAKLQTGLVVQVPEYMSPEEVVRVDTRTSEFLSRA